MHQKDSDEETLKTTNLSGHVQARPQLDLPAKKSLARVSIALQPSGFHRALALPFAEIDYSGPDPRTHRHKIRYHVLHPSQMKWVELDTVSQFERNDVTSYYFDSRDMCDELQLMPRDPDDERCGNYIILAPISMSKRQCLLPTPDYEIALAELIGSTLGASAEPSLDGYTNFIIVPQRTHYLRWSIVPLVVRGRKVSGIDVARFALRVFPGEEEKLAEKK